MEKYKLPYINVNTEVMHRNQKVIRLNKLYVFFVCLFFTIDPFMKTIKLSLCVCGSRAFLFYLGRIFAVVHLLGTIFSSQ